MAAIARRLDEGQQAARRRYEEATAAGHVRPLPWTIAHSLMVGPAYNYLRFVAAGRAAEPEAAQLLAEAAWEAVRRKPAPAVP